MVTDPYASPSRPVAWESSLTEMRGETIVDGDMRHRYGCILIGW